MGVSKVVAMNHVINPNRINPNYAVFVVDLPLDATVGKSS